MSNGWSKGVEDNDIGNVISWKIYLLNYDSPNATMCVKLTK